MDRLDRRSDDELLQATGRNPDAFGIFYERHFDAVLALVRRQTSDAEAALDLTAEVFAAALIASRRYRPGEAPARAWLFGIARNKLLASRKRNALDQSARRRLGMTRLSFSDEALERVDEALSTAEGGTLTRGMESLTADEHEAVTARVLDERQYEDIASASGVSEAAVRQRVSRGLAKLARLGGRGQA